ncbi:hypothetical protein RJ639_001015 [Escallonia herrerae]|uniref:Uncharacterized protein n=1 Tax=Escallonia herrerae TaxID=1293975 RepID=A0AA88XAX8_9ASTE|nr:hypothetical protein RJ639_001015 [Escallonia herrerae]
MNQDLVKLNCFHGNNYAQWKDKMMFLLTTLRISYILDPDFSPPPEEPRTSVKGVLPDTEEIERVKKEMKKHEDDELLIILQFPNHATTRAHQVLQPINLRLMAKTVDLLKKVVTFPVNNITMATSETIPESGPNYILNGLDNALYNVYSPMVNAKALWESLERKYKTEDAGSKKFVVGKFLDFKMVDSKTVISQVQEFQLILHDIHAEGMVLGESFQVAALIEKLPPTWKDFKNYLKHKRKEMKLEDLIVRLRIEEDNRQSEKKAGNYHQEAKANVVEQVTLQGKDGQNQSLKSSATNHSTPNALFISIFVCTVKKLEAYIVKKSN